MTDGATVSPRNKMRFLLDGELQELTDVDPTRTVLQYLRDDLRRTGTKEGCAEGDCGACTVAVGDVDPATGRLRVEAVNACIRFLPTLDGKALYTVESLSADGSHPVQQALVRNHGSQCGFCTPGFVMSLFCLFKSSASPDRRAIDDALAGNLCRCTGYSPIIIAALEMYADAPAAGDWISTPFGLPATSDEALQVEKLHALQSDSPLQMECDGRKYIAPLTLDGLAAAIIEHPEATILAGGTDVGLWVTKQQQNLDTVIYVGSVAGLDTVTEQDDCLVIGAAASLTTAMNAIVRHYPSANELFLRFASPPIRNAGTLAGNIANGSPIGDSMPLLMTLGTTLTLRAGEANREVRLDEFYTGYRQSLLAPGEFVAAIKIPLPKKSTLVRTYKVSKRFDQDISAVCGAFSLDLDAGTVRDIAIAYGGVAATPLRLTDCEAALRGKPWTEASVSAALAVLDRTVEPITDMRASAGYRQAIVRNLLRRFFIETTNGPATGVYDYGR